MIRCATILIVILAFSANRSFGQKTVTHYPVFETDAPQSMWGPGESGINQTIELFPRFGYKSPVLDTRPSSIFGFGGFQFGAGIYASFEFGVGPLQFRISDFEDGSITVRYPVRVDLTMPDDSTFNAGQEITLNTSYSVEEGFELNSFYPETGEIALEIPILFDMKAGAEFCIVSCYDYSFFPPEVPGVTYPDPLIDQNWIILGVNKDEFTYPCLNVPIPSCTEPMPQVGFPTLPPNSPVSGSLKIPYVETTASVSGKDLVATGGDTYLDVDLDVVKLLSLAPPPVGTVFNAVSSGIRLPPGGIPDFGGTRRYLDINWTLFTLFLGMPFTHTQEFTFKPDVYLELNFVTEVEYSIEDKVFGKSSAGKSSSIELPVGADLTIRFPCEYDFMDLTASYSMTNSFTNRTYDHVDIDLTFAALQFGIGFPDFDIIPEFCVDIPFVGEVCIGLTLPGFTIEIPPGGGFFIEPDPVILASFDLPDYYNKTWELEGFSDFPVTDPFRLVPAKRRLEIASASGAECYRDSSGIADLEVFGATAPYKYKWSNGNTAQDLTNALAGTHYVIVEDVNGCREHGHIVISEPDPVRVNLEKEDALCYASPTGSANLITSGGTAPYSFDWSDGGTGPSRTSLPAGTYVVTITDNNDCVYKETIEIEEPQELQAAPANVIPPACSGFSDGKVLIQVSGGTQPYRYQWSEGSREKDLFSVPAGTYNLTVTDTNDCSKDLTITISEPLPLEASVDVSSEVRCYNGSDGVLVATVTGGTPPYSLEWLNNSIKLGRNTPTIDKLSPGEYTLQVTDKNICFTAGSALMPGPAEPVRVSVAGTPVTCFMGSDGRAEASVSGGTPPYSAIWSDEQTGMTATNLKAGEKIVTVTDANGCTEKGVILLSQGAPIEIELKATEVSCADQQDGSVVSTITGGVKPLIYTWSTGSSEPEIRDLSEGIYTLTVTDRDNCKASSTAEVVKLERECLFIPNAFSPNADGTNDTWDIRNIEIYPYARVAVFNKWGERVYEADPFKAWNGTRNGKLLPPATYYYILDLGNGDPELTGPLSIVQ